MNEHNATHDVPAPVVTVDKPSLIATEFRAFMCTLGGCEEDGNAGRAFYELATALNDGHSCLDLTGLAIDNSVVEWKDLLKALPVVTDVTSGVADSTAPPTPLVLNGNRLYMQRYYLYEQRIADQLRRRNQPRLLTDDVSYNTIVEAIKNLPAGTDQKTALFLALHRGLTVITGGPGTGKTTTVAHLIKLYRSTIGSDEALRVRVAAPTGKAANRLALALADFGQGDIPVSTVHRLLGRYADGRGYRHGPHNPLIIDLLVVDEVSMINLAMMDRLLSALPSTVRLVLLGDVHQLPSVTAGNVLADLGQSPPGFSISVRSQIQSALGFDPVPPTAAPTEKVITTHDLQDAMVSLTQNYRFNTHEGIGRLAREVVSGINPTLTRIAPDTTLAEQHDADGSVVLISLDDDEDIGARLLETYNDYFSLLANRPPPQDLLLAFEQTRILCPAHEGPLGVNGINAYLTAEARRRLSLTDPRGHEYFHGRPIIVTRNDYNLRLFNGDIGICFEDEDSRPKVAFQTGERIQVILAARLPDHETCFAMTIHKAQGSEFDHTVVALPPFEHLRNDLVNRQLLYTAVTRARRSVTLLATPESIASAVRRSMHRMSGLPDQLLSVESRPSITKKPADQLTLF